MFETTKVNGESKTGNVYSTPEQGVKNNNLSGSQNAVPTAAAPSLQTAPGVEEFRYQPKPRFNFKKPSKIIVMILTFVILLVPLAFVYLKLNPFATKNVQKKGEIVWWTLGLNESVLNKMVENYRTDNPDAQIKLIIQSPADYRERLENSLKGGKGPDVFTIHNSWVPMFVSHLDAIPPSIYSKEDFAKAFYPVIVNNVNTSSGLVGIPLEYDALTLYINEDIFSFSGKSVPTTWDEFSQVATDLTTRDDKGLILQSGAAMGLTANVDYWPEIIALLMLQNKSNLYAPSSKTDYEAISAFGEFNSTLKTWNNTLPASTRAFADGKLAMFFAPGRVAAEIKEINPNLKFKTVVVPQVRRDDPNEPEVAYSTYWIQSVWKNSADKDLAWNFLKFLSSEENLTKMSDISKVLGVQPLIYPRISMRDKIINDRIFGSIVAQAPFASSWYLADKTNDGESGINSTVNAAYKKTVDLVSGSKGNRYSTAFFKILDSDLKKALMPSNITR